MNETISRGCTKNVFLIGALFMSSHSMMVVAQNESTNVAEVSAEDYVQILLGEKEHPSSGGVFKIKEEESGLNTQSEDISNNNDAYPKVSTDAMPTVELPEEVAFARATAIYFHIIDSDVKKFGFQNAAKLIEQDIRVDRSQAQQLIAYVDVVLAAYSQEQNAHLLDNCYSFNATMSADGMGAEGKQIAVDGFIQRQANLADLTDDYFGNVLDSGSGLDPQVRDTVASKILSISTGMRAFHVSSLEALESLGQDTNLFRIETVCNRL